MKKNNDNLLKTLALKIIFGSIFFLLITPISFLIKILGKDLLNLKKNKQNSYWIKKQSSKDEMRNQY